MLLLRRIVFFFILSLPVQANNHPALEYKVKAAYLYNFTKFISWPEKQSETFNLCVLGADNFIALLKPLEQRTALGMPIRLMRLDSVEQAGSCHILYVDDDRTLSQSERPLTSLMAGGGLDGILTVSSEPLFAQRGGMIGFILRDGRIRLQVNLAEFKKNGLKISAKLTEIAELVGGSGDE